MKFLLLLITGALLMSTNKYTEVRGLRLNNPGNIERNGIGWQGLATDQPDARFAKFVSPEYGIRAMGRILNSYAKRGVNTVRTVINTWAPPHENNTGAYVRHVADRLGVDPDDALSGGLQERTRLVAAIIRHEQGLQPFSDEFIKQSLQIA